MLTVKEVINTLQKNDKVRIIYINDEEFEGYVESISHNHLTIHEYVSDIYRTFNLQQILEIESI